MNWDFCLTITRRYGDRCSRCNRVTDTSRVELAASCELAVIYLCDRCQEAGQSLALRFREIDDDTGDRVRKRIKQSRAMEKELAEDMHGRAQPGSGCSRLPGYKGDVRQMGQWRLEHKFTDSIKNYTLRLFDIARITKIAMEASELPALVINFRIVGEAFAVIPYYLFLEMADAIEKYTRPTESKRGGKKTGTNAGSSDSKDRSLPRRHKFGRK